MIVSNENWYMQNFNYYSYFVVARTDGYTKNTNVAPANADDVDHVVRTEGYTNNTNVVQTNAGNVDHVARTDGYTKDTNVVQTDAGDADNGQYVYSAFLPQTIIIVIGSTMIILVIFLIFKEYLSKNDHVNVITHTEETEVVDQSIIILNEETNDYENIDESIIMQSDNNVQLNLTSRCVEHYDPYSGDTGDYLNIFTASVYENAGRKEEENDYENYSRSNMDSVDDTYQNTCMCESLRGQRNSNDGYSPCRSVRIDEDTETEYATIVGEICLYKS
ncbi:unnamed protein product [Mytilus coruscus]|uniref:Uncharacterized protein n=1 Tax=Mytilus coruscus TaxID=42192 RepID=A0A6J8EIX0_MYTCO|nr:unnamed protein product [Mytilus coruscus]